MGRKGGASVLPRFHALDIRGDSCSLGQMVQFGEAESEVSLGGLQSGTRSVESERETLPAGEGVN